MAPEAGFHGNGIHGNVTTVTPSDDIAQKATFGLASVFVFIVVVVVVIIARRWCRRGRSSSSPPSESSESGDQRVPGDAAGTQRDCGGYGRQVLVPGGDEAVVERKTELPSEGGWDRLGDDVRCMLRGHVIERSRLRLGNVVGTGEFGYVYEARLFPVQDLGDDYCPMSSQKVAVKSLKAPSITEDMIESFLKEGMIMRNFDHRNVLSLIGVAIDDSGIPLIVLPFMQNGNLKKYIMDASLVLTVRNLLSFGHQVASGMKYLAEKKFVHRDLATRNCMLDGDLVVKVADFGLSRDLYSRDYYSSGDRCAKVPMRWLAPECLSSARYTVKSDVWSFGVLVWELLTRGSVPYTDIDNWDIQRYVLSGQRLTQPRLCPNQVYRHMLSCWSLSPKERPSFEEICEFYRKILVSAVVDTSDNDYVNLTSNVEMYQSQNTDEGTTLLNK